MCPTGIGIVVLCATGHVLRATGSPRFYGGTPVESLSIPERVRGVKGTDRVATCQFERFTASRFHCRCVLREWCTTLGTEFRINRLPEIFITGRTSPVEQREPDTTSKENNKSWAPDRRGHAEHHMVRVLPKEDKEDDHRNEGNRDDDLIPLPRTKLGFDRQFSSFCVLHALPPYVHLLVCLSPQKYLLHSDWEVQFQGQIRPRLRLPPESKVRSDFMSEHHPDIR